MGFLDHAGLKRFFTGLKSAFQPQPYADMLKAIPSLTASCTTAQALSALGSDRSVCFSHSGNNVINLTDPPELGCRVWLSPALQFARGMSGKQYIYRNGAWEQIYTESSLLIQSGSIAITIPVGSYQAAETVTYAAAYASAPAVSVAMGSMLAGSSGARGCGLTAVSDTSAGIRAAISAVSSSAQTVTVRWTAIGLKA